MRDLIARLLATPADRAALAEARRERAASQARAAADRELIDEAVRVARRLRLHRETNNFAGRLNAAFNGDHR